MAKRKLTEQEIERIQVEQVFMLTGGELEDKSATFPKAEDEDGSPRASPYSFAYWFTGVPEYAASDFGLRYSANNPDYFTAIDLAPVYGSPPHRLTDTDGSVWELVQTYANSGETACPFGEMGLGDMVTRDHAQLTPKLPGLVKGRKAVCPFCEARIGEPHGYIYIGDCAERVYKRVSRLYEVTYHFDVWGNAEDGWQVNDSRRDGTVLLPVDATPEQVWSALVEAGIAHGAFADAQFEDLGEGWGINDAEGCPTFDVQPKE